MFHFQNQQIFKIYFKKLWIKLNKKKNTDSSQGGRGAETTVLLGGHIRLDKKEWAEKKRYKKRSGTLLLYARPFYIK